MSKWAALCSPEDESSPVRTGKAFFLHHLEAMLSTLMTQNLMGYTGIKWQTLSDILWNMVYRRWFQRLWPTDISSSTINPSCLLVDMFCFIMLWEHSLPVPSSANVVMLDVFRLIWLLMYDVFMLWTNYSFLLMLVCSAITLLISGNIL